MNVMRTLALLLAVSSALFAQKGAETEASLINRVRASAATYTERLQDFLCLEHLVRYTASAGEKQRWKKLEQQELEVSYTKEVPHYRLLSVNGKTDKLEKRIKHGYFLPGGEFGALAWVFDPRARPDCSSIIAKPPTRGAQSVCFATASRCSEPISS